MLPACEIEISAELAVNAREQVFVELGSHAGAIVVGCLDDMSIFLEIDANEQTAAFAGEIDEASKEFAGRVRLEISNCRSRKINHAACGKFSWERQLERFEIVGGDRKDLKIRKHFTKTRGRCFELLFRNIDRHVHDRVAQFFE